MQPLNTSVKPSSLSTIGCAPCTERSMIDSRRCPNATGPCAMMPSESGPRATIAPVIRATAATSAARPSNRTSPQIPHIPPPFLKDQDERESGPLNHFRRYPRSHEVDMTDSPRPGSPSDPTTGYQDPYQGYTDPAYAGSAPLGPSYNPMSTPSNPSATEPLPQYWTQTTYPQPGPARFLGEEPPEPPRGPRPWLWAGAGFAIAVVLGMVVWLIFVNTNPSRQATSIPAMPQSTTSRTPTSTTT